MKNEISCNIVQDLLPNFIEKLTSNETNEAIEKHIATCEYCKRTYEQMNSEISSSVKAPFKELKFFKKIERTRLLAAVLTCILALNFAYMLYTTEFKYSNDKNILATGITEFLSKQSINAYVLETKEIENILIATFKDQTRTNIKGIATFVKGFNHKYRIISAKYNTEGSEINVSFNINEDTDNSAITNITKENRDYIYISMLAVMELGIILMIFFLN